MKATVVDIRRNPKKIIDAIRRNEKVTLSARGRKIAEIVPKRDEAAPSSVAEDPAVGMWKDRPDMADPSVYVRDLRGPC